MKGKKLAISLISASFIALAQPVFSSEHEDFNSFMGALAKKIEHKSDYVRIPIDTDKQSKAFVRQYFPIQK